jgi:hypothetical protein
MQRTTTLGRVGVEVAVPSKIFEQSFQGLRLERPDAVAVDEASVVASPLTSGRAAAPGIASTARYSGFRKQRLPGKYGLGCCGRVGVAACRGLTSTKPAPIDFDHRPRRSRSSKSPKPQLRRDRVAYSWAANPHVSWAGSGARPGLTIRVTAGPSSGSRRW